MRTCLGCRESKPKKELIRIVKTAEKLLEENKEKDPVRIDGTGKMAGRGAYICPDINCLKLLRKSKRLEKEFEMAIDGKIYDLLEISMEKFNGG